MDNNEFSNLGKIIQDTVQDAVESMNYDRLNQTINQTVNQALHEARIYKDKVQQQYKESQYRQAERMREKQEKAKTDYRYQPNYTKKISKHQIKMMLAPGVKKGTLPICLGVIFSILGIISLLGWELGKLFGFDPMLENEMVILGLFFAILVIGCGMVFFGKKKRRRYKLAFRYAEILNGRGFCELEELSQKTGVSLKEVRKNVRELIQKKIFREAYLDRQETCLMINRIAYDYYLQAEESLKERQQEEERRKEEEAKMSPEIQEMIRIGDEYIRTIREANDDIPGEIISAKLDRLEQVVRRIFESVKKHPEQKDEMDKFMDYYMPTTLKLVNAYREFDALDVKGENITTAMQEIENTLDTISQAFEKLLDDLFQDAAFDVSTDISVLQMMLEREGYKEKDFK